jgi:peptidyl-prolyl cis-trans isomerase C
MWKKPVAGALACALLTCAAAPALDPQAVLLENGPVAINALDFEAAMTRFPEELRLVAQANPETIMTLIDSLFVNRVLARRAMEAKLDQDPLVKQRLEHFRESFLAQKYLDHVERNVRVPNLEARAQELYKADPKRFTEGPAQFMRHVLVGLRGRTPEQATARALEARTKLAQGAPLRDVVRQYSEDPSARVNYGELGWIREGDIEPALVAAASKAPLNTWTDPIITASGAHLVLVTERKPGGLRKFEEVKDIIIKEETVKLRQRAVDEEVKAIRSDPKNLIHADRVKSLKTEVDITKVDRAAREAIEHFKKER